MADSGFVQSILEELRIMKITKILIKNFRLLEDVELCLGDCTTLIVGRNNSGKTSLTELFRRLLDEEKTSQFKLEDFSLGVHEQFWIAYAMYKSGKEEAEIRKILPMITATINIEYEKDEELGPLADFVIDLNEKCTTTQAIISYELAAGKISPFFTELNDTNKNAFFKNIKERIPKLFEICIEAQDPNDVTNRQLLKISHLRSVLQFAFINAQRALDDATYKEKAVLGKILEKLFISATSETASEADQTTAAALMSAAETVQEQINNEFNDQLKNLAPTFDLFGYPGLTDPKLMTETVLEVERLLSNHTTVGYLGENGLKLPESYNGLGPRNLIYILLKLYAFFKEYMNRQPASGVHLIFIEEPEAHLHPQMQSVFIRKLEEICYQFGHRYNDGKPWPVQFVVTTHSSHIANEASFECIRYFLAKKRQKGSHLYKTDVKDFCKGLSTEEEASKEFLHKYMTLTRCDLLFADRAILVEGATERLLLPEMIRKFDELGGEKLGNKYLTIMEVGGAYAHLFFKLIDFLNLRTLIITDIDTIKKVETKREKGPTSKWEKCPVSKGLQSSNSCINTWFKGPNGSGLIEHENLTYIGKKANFRSATNIVNVLNRMRPGLPQEVKDPESAGKVAVYHSNTWTGQRRSGSHWAEDLPPEEAHTYLEKLKQKLADEGWDLSPDKTKILMLTHNILANELQYSQIANAYRYKESFTKKEDPHIEFLVDTIEPVCEAFQDGRYGEMFAIIGNRSDYIRSHKDKETWTKDMNELIQCRENGTIGEVLNTLKRTHRPRLPDKVQGIESDLEKASQEEIDESLTLSQINKLRKIPYKEVQALASFINDRTPFSTKHGVKGAEFENVLVVLGRGWNQYNWNQFLEWVPDKYPANKKDFYERNRNLFYVTCSRPKQRLALLYTQKLSNAAMGTLKFWFGNENVIPLSLD